MDNSWQFNRFQNTLQILLWRTRLTSLSAVRSRLTSHEQLLLKSVGNFQCHKAPIISRFSHWLGLASASTASGASGAAGERSNAGAAGIVARRSSGHAMPETMAGNRMGKGASPYPKISKPWMFIIFYWFVYDIHQGCLGLMDNMYSMDQSCFWIERCWNMFFLGVGEIFSNGDGKEGH